MEIIGRVTANAEVKTIKDDKQVVNFDVAINDSYKTKEGERKAITTFVQCSYWLSPKIAEQLTKGTIVSLYGRIGINAYINMSGDAKASLTFHVNSIKLIAKPNRQEVVAAEVVAAQQSSQPASMDAPPF